MFCNGTKKSLFLTPLTNKMCYFCLLSNKQVNDLVRDQIRDSKTGQIHIVGEVLAGGCVSHFLTNQPPLAGVIHVDQAL